MLPTSWEGPAGAANPGRRRNQKAPLWGAMTELNEEPEKLEEEPHGLYKSIYWNKEQLVGLLNHCFYVIFAADYSAE